MDKHGNELLELLNALQQATSLESAFDAYHNTVIALGYDGALYGYAPKLFATEPLFKTPVSFAAGLYLEGFAQHYSANACHEHDYSVRAIVEGREDAFDWWQDKEQGRTIHCREVELLQTARNFGIINGITIPLMNDANGFAGIGVVSRKHNAAFRTLNTEKLASLIHTTQLFNAYVWNHASPELRCLFNRPILAQLNTTERAILKRLPTHKNIADIATDINRSPKYCENVLSGIRKKFGNVTTHRLVYYSGVLHFEECL